MLAIKCERCGGKVQMFNRFFLQMSIVCTLKEEVAIDKMTAAQQVNEFVWKPGRTGNIDFCGNFKRLQEKEPKTAALLLGHFEEEGFQTQDSEYIYKIYHSQYGYSVGRRKKPVPDTSTEENTLPLPKNTPNVS
ncbi:MAG: hypothetical protein WCF23_05955 [Candidatus Nitrosopolaris sp.]